MKKPARRLRERRQQDRQNRRRSRAAKRRAATRGLLLESLESRELLAVDFFDIRGAGNVDLENFGQFAEVGGNLVFSGNDGSFGNELWKSDGTNTTLLADINPGAIGSSLSGFTTFQGTTYFAANDGINGSELWKTDGTTTSLVADINTGSESSSPQNFTVIGSTLFFTATDSSGGNELWKTDGTAQNTVRVADLRPSTGSSSPRELTAVGNTLFFTADDGTFGREVWSSDGNTATRLTDINTSGNSLSSSRSLTNVGGTLFFSATTGTGPNQNYELWKIDGATPSLVAEINPNGSSRPQFLTAIGNTVFFSANDGSTGKELWKSDGTTTVRVADIRGGVNAGSDPLNLTNVGGTLFFRANDGVNGTELWKSDGATVALVANIGPSNQGSFPNNLTDVGGTLYFTARDGTNGTEVWKSDGTTTTRVTDIVPDTGYTSPANLTNVGGTLFFSSPDDNYEIELYKTDGTIVTLLPGSGNSGSDPTHLVDANGKALFRATDGSVGFELFGSDGTVAGTGLVRDIRSGPPDSLSSSSNRVPANLNGTLFFAANDGTRGSELWKSDGTLEGTQIVRDIRIGEFSSGINSLTALNDVVAFRASDGNETRLWKSDGTENGTVEVTNFAPQNLTNVGGTLFFTGNNGSTGHDGLFTFDGTNVNLVADLIPNGSAYPRNLTSSGGKLFFSLSNASYQDYELWVSDGTTANRVRDINQGTPSSTPRELTDVGGTLYFTANDGTNGVELWKSDGTENGTVLVRDIIAGSPSGNPLNLTNVDGTLFFTANDGIHGTELWKSNGNANDTVMVQDINPNGSSNPSELTAVAGSLLFAASDGTHGQELWRHTVDTTTMVMDIVPGPGSSDPDELTAVAGSLYFSVVTLTRGRELARFQPPQLRVDKVVSDATANGFAQPGEVLTYTLTIRNELPRAETNIVISDAAPAGTTFVPSSAQQVAGPDGLGVTIVKGDDPGENSFEVRIDSLPATSSPVQFSFQVTVNGPTPGVATITNTAQITSDLQSTFNSNIAEIPVGLYVVDSLEDNTNADGMLTLREAILAANSDTAVGDAAAGSGADTIVFAPGLQGTINLTTAGDTTRGPSAFGITTPIAIVGNPSGSGIALSAGGNKRHFYVSSIGNLTLDSLTLTGGSSTGGGAIRNEGIVTILDSTLSGNTHTGGGFDGGGAIFNNAGSVVLKNATVSGNNSNGFGGGVFNANGNIRSTNVTFANNSANSGGALFNTASGVVLLENSILADSTGADDLQRASGTIDARNSLIEAGGNAVNGVNVGNIINVDPALGPLASNGGPTQTHQASLSSPVTDQGDNALAMAAGLTTDQTGASRIVGTVDIGAYEFPEPVNLVVSTLVDEDDGNYAAGDLSLREAISLVTAGRRAITFDPALTARGDAIIDLTMSTSNQFESSALTIDTFAFINGPTGFHGITIRRPSTAADFRLFHVTDTGNLSMTNLTLSGGIAQGGNGAGSFVGGAGGGGAGMGGGIFNEGTLTLDGVTMTNNQAIGGTGARSFVGSTNGPGARGGGATGGAGGALNGRTPGFAGSPGGFAGGGGGGGGFGEQPGIGGAGGAGGFGAGGGGGGQYWRGGGPFGAAGAGGFGGGDALNTASGGGAGMGGAIFNQGALTVNNSTFSGNSALGGNGGLGAQHAGAGLGGAIFSLNSRNVGLTHTTITNNTVSGAGADGGGIYSLGDGAIADLFLGSTIVADSIGATNDLVATTNASGTHTSFGGFNLVESQTGFVGSIVSTSDPQLLPLSDNGGPTPTHALPNNSPAVNTGAPGGAGFDQRGNPFVRLFGPQRDIGAFEAQTDTFSPVLASFTRQSPTAAITNADTVVFRATFSEDVINVDGTDFSTVGPIGEIPLVATQVNGRTYDLSASGSALVNYNGLLGINVFNLTNITDTAGNALTPGEPAVDETYTLDNVAPQLLSFTRQEPTSQSTNFNTLVFRATFDEDVTGVDAADFSITGGTTATITNIAFINARTYDLTVSGGNLPSFVGTVGLDIASLNNIADPAGNALTLAEPATDETYTLTNIVPTLLSFTRQNPMSETTSADTLVFRATFDADVLNVSVGDFVVDGGSTARVSNVTPAGARTYDITLSGGDLPIYIGTVGLDVSVANDILSTDGTRLTPGEPAIDQTYSVTNVVPRLLSFTRQSPTVQLTNADSLVFRATFGDDVLNVDAADFNVNGGSTAGVTNVTPAGGRTYDITVSGGDLASYNGTVGLELSNANDITDAQGGPLIGGGLLTDETFTLDNTAPQLVSFTRQNPISQFTNLNTLVFQATFDSDVANVDGSDFSVAGSTAGITNVTPVDARTYAITVSGGDLAGFNGTVGLNVSNANDMADPAGNALTPGEPSTDETFIVDNTAPQALSFTRQNPTSPLTSADVLVFRATFDEGVTNVSNADFSVSGGSTAGVTNVTLVSPSTYDVTVAGGNLASYNGSVGLNFGITDITDLAGNPFVASEPSTDETYTIDNNSFIVTTLSDVADGNLVDLSLREAIMEANQSPLNVIRFSPDLSGGTIQLNSQLPTITRDLTITGLGSSLLTIDAGDGQDNQPRTGDGFRILEVDDGSSFFANVVISGLTLTGGDVGNAGLGGAIYTAENLTINNTVLAANSSGEDGGAIFVASSTILRVTGSTLSGNHAADNGGAISLFSSLLILNDSTLSQNTGRLGGGVGMVGGGIAATNSTFSGNSATFGGAIANVNGQVRVAHSTLAANTAGTGDSLLAFTLGPTLVNQFDNSIITGTLSTPTLTGNYNLFSSTVAIAGTGNLQNTNPQLGPLQNNGGSTQTHLPATNSPALDAGDPNVSGEPPFDQRGTGFPRIVASRIDIGAVEVDYVAPTLVSFTRQNPASQLTNADTLVFRATFDEDVMNVDSADFSVNGTTTATITTVTPVTARIYDITVSGGDLAGFGGTVGLDLVNNDIMDLSGNALPLGEPATDESYLVANLSQLVVSTLSDSVDNDFSAGQLSLREAILLANALQDLTTITFAGNLSGGTINLDSQLPNINSHVTITGPGSSLLTIDAGDGLDNTFATGDGYRILSVSNANPASTFDVVISGLTLTGGDMASDGGAIFSMESLTIRDVVLTANATRGFGGAIHNEGGVLRITDSTLTGNHAADGGAIGSFGSTLNVIGSTIAHNNAVFLGGGIYFGNFPAANMNVWGSTLSGNSANTGGGILSDGGVTRINHSTLTGNTAPTGGGAIFGVNPYEISNSIIAGSVRLTTTPTGNFNLFSTTVAITGTGNLQNMDPKLGPLQNNGGLTPTHAPQSDSPAIGAGDPRAVAGVAGVPHFDQRGSGFGRVDGGRLDIGALEVNVAPTLVRFIRQNPTSQITNADTLVFRATFDEDVTNVDAADFSVSGTTSATITTVNPVNARNYDITVSGGDLANFNGTVGLDLAISDITDLVGNPLPPGEPVTDESYLVNNLSRLVVSTLSDSVDNDFSAGQLSLREAILLAEALSNVTTIEFSNSLAGGTINLSSQLPTITTDLTITGLGSSLLTIDAGNGADNTFATGDGYRIFEFREVPLRGLRTIVLSGLTLTGGDVGDRQGQGGAIDNWENLTIRDVVITGNFSDIGGGIAHTAVSGGGAVTSLNIIDSTISGNRAGIVGGGLRSSAATVNVSNSTFSNNSADVGGGITNGSSGTLNVMNSTVSGNSSTRFGGGILGFSGFVTIDLSTVVGNTAGTTGDAFSGGNPDGVHASLLFNNSIFTGSVDLEGSAAGNFNLFSSTVTITGTGNLQNTDPKLGPLQSNGGPTQTHAPLNGSPVINAGDPAAVAGANGVPQFDQRGAGFGRVDGGRVDIGAFEVNVSPTLLSFTRQNPTAHSTNADSLVLRAMFDEDVSNVDASDFAVGGGTTALVNNVTPVDARTYDITVSGGDLASFNGTVGIDFANSNDITDSAGNPLVPGEPWIDETFTLDNIAPQVESIAYEDGTPQRSVIRSITVKFDSQVVVDPGAFVLTTQSGIPVTVSPTISVVGGKTQAILTFGGSQVNPSGSLLDGNYRLTILDTHVRDLAGNALDGDKNGSPGAAAVDEFFRLFGDADGDRDVDRRDFAFFRRTNGRRSGDPLFNAAFDWDNDGDVDRRDYAFFRRNYLKTLAP